MDKTTQTEEQIKAIIQDAAKELKPIVESIEKSTPTTKDHYGKYMSLLSHSKEERQRRVMALALIEAGANKEGVSWALKLLS